MWRSRIRMCLWCKQHYLVIFSNHRWEERLNLFWTVSLCNASDLQSGRDGCRTFFHLCSPSPRHCASRWCLTPFICTQSPHTVGPCPPGSSGCWYRGDARSGWHSSLSPGHYCNADISQTCCISESFPQTVLGEAAGHDLHTQQSPHWGIIQSPAKKRPCTKGKESYLFPWGIFFFVSCSREKSISCTTDISIQGFYMKKTFDLKEIHVFVFLFLIICGNVTSLKLNFRQIEKTRSFIWSFIHY